MQYEKKGNQTTVEFKKCVSYVTYCWCTRKCDKDWLTRNNTTTKLEILHKIAPKKLKNIVRYSKDPQKQPSRGALGKRCSENMQQIYRRPRNSSG